MLSQKLTTDQQDAILYHLFGLEHINCGTEEAPHMVLCDEDGNEFYGQNQNKCHDLSTLGGIFRYAEVRYKAQGMDYAREQMKKAIGF